MSKSIIATVIVLLLIIVGTTYIAFAPESWKFWHSTAVIQDPATTTPETPDPSFPRDRINAKHQFKNGMHIVAGEVNLPNPCYILTTTAQIAESYPEQVTLNFSAKTSDDVCAQVITTERFKADFKASSDATIKAMWNGKPVEINLIPAGPNEDLSNFELFIKG